MTDIYDDPALRADMDDSFPPTLKFVMVGDRAKGVVTEVGKLENRNGVALKYKLAEVTARQEGEQTKLDRAELLAGTKNLKGQLLQLRPRPGDTLDITLAELRPSQYGNPAKIFRVVHTSALAAPPSVDGDDEKDMFDS
jgi:hypothetical protein